MTTNTEEKTPVLPETGHDSTESTGNGVQELIEACRTRLQEVDAKKVAAPIVEAAGKTIVISLGVGLALTALYIKAVVDAAKEAGAQNKVEAPAPDQSAAPATTEASASEGTATKDATSTKA